MVILLLIVLTQGMTGCSNKKIRHKDFLKSMHFETLEVIGPCQAKDFNKPCMNNEIFKDKKLTMINIWDTNCQPCIDEMPELQALYDEMKGQGVNIMGVVMDGRYNRLSALHIIKESDVTFMNIIPNEKIKNDLLRHINVVPLSIFVNSKGEVVGGPIEGSRSKEEYRRLIEKTLKE